MATTNHGQVPHKPAAQAVGENGNATRFAQYTDSPRACSSTSRVEVKSWASNLQSTVAEGVAEEEECSLSCDRWQDKKDGKVRSMDRNRLAKQRRFSERGYVGRSKHTKEERSEMARLKRISTHTEGLSRRERCVRQHFNVPAVRSRAEIDTDLVRGGVEENPGPKKARFQSAPRQMSCQEKREMTRAPLTEEAQAAIVRRSFICGGKCSVTKTQYKKACVEQAKEEAKTAHQEEMEDVEQTFSCTTSSLFEDAAEAPSAPSSTTASRPSDKDEDGDAEFVDCIALDEPPCDKDGVPLPPAQSPCNPKDSHLRNQIRNSRPFKNIPGPTRHLIPDDPLPPDAPHPPPAPVVFQKDDLRGDVLIKNDQRDERLMFAKCLFGPFVSIVDATIERYVPAGDHRKATQRGVNLLDKPFEVRHLRVRVGPSKLGAVVGYSLILLELIFASWIAVSLPIVGDYIAMAIITSALYYYSTMMSEPRTKTLKKVFISIALKFAISSLPHSMPHYVLLRALGPQLIFLTLPLVPKGIRTVSYMPHLVSCLLGEYKRGTTLQTMDATIHQKTMRMASLPLPDRTAAWTANDLEVGSEQVAEFLNLQQDFGRAPPTALPGVSDSGAL